MKQSVVIKLDQTFRKSFHKEMKDSLDVLKYTQADLRAFLSQVSSKNPFLVYDINHAQEGFDIEAFSKKEESLADIIQMQNDLSNHPLQEDLVAFLVSRLDSNGYFKEDEDALVHESLYSRQEISDAIRKLSHFEPVGCFSFSLKDCLEAQCEESMEAPSETGAILCSYLEEVATKRWDLISDKTSLSVEEIGEGVHFLQTLNPKPAANYAKDSLPLIPEAKITIINENIQVNLLQQDFQLDLIEIEEKNLSKTMLQLRKDAKTLWNQVQKRYLTILQILQVLCGIQKDFFLTHGPIRHCTMEEVAKQCEIHVSTVSRAIQGKSFEFDNTYYPIKILFSHKGNQQMSDQEIMKRLLKMIDQEDPQHPYSDSKLQKLLKEQDISISRRTIAKYRQDHGIPSSMQRRHVHVLKTGE